MATQSEATDARQAVQLMRRAAEGGYGPAQEALARLYSGDDGGFRRRIEAPRNGPSAAKWARRHAENKVADPRGDRRQYSMGLLAKLYFDGQVSGAPDYAAAKAWAAKSVSGSSHARYVMWQLFDRGLGVPKDPLIAEYWRFRFEQPSSPYAVQVSKGEWPFEKKLLLAQQVFSGRAERFNLVTMELSPTNFATWVEAEIVVTEIVRSEPNLLTRGERVRVVVGYSAKDQPEIERAFLNRPLIYPVVLLNHQPARGAAVKYYALVGNAGLPTPIDAERSADVQNTLTRIRELALNPFN